MRLRKACGLDLAEAFRYQLADRVRYNTRHDLEAVAIQLKNQMRTSCSCWQVLPCCPLLVDISAGRTARRQR